MTCPNKEKAGNVTAGYFDSYANEFDSIYGSWKGLPHRLVNRYLRGSVRERFKLTLEACSPVEGKTVLDVGCGPGHYSVGLAMLGAKEVTGIDFAPGMVELARAKAAEKHLQEVCKFEVRDFFSVTGSSYNYLILMGFMDYIADAEACVRHSMGLFKEKAFFSFPVSGGFLAWQRKLRYRRKCPLYLYSYADVVRIFTAIPGIRFRIRNLKRDYWVEAWHDVM
ncbi:MAG TPA: methyltransferase domain-containing protein [Candidatus Syntrophosphaera sp.]|nr:methyltransferase domain-containing protein [Candidatus Syntrophosphaera sp.]